MTVVAERDAKGHFQVGHIGLGGRPEGSRNKLGEAFVADLYKDWMKHGAQVLRTVRTEDPVAYAKIVALLVAKNEDFGASASAVTVVNVITGVPG